VQIEIEQRQEVLDRVLFDPDWLPESIEELVDRLDYPRLEPEPVGGTRRTCKPVALRRRAPGAAG
jgi:hypothetical protein